MNRLFDKSETPSSLIKNLLWQGKTSSQIYLIVHDHFPSYSEKKLRNLISVHKARSKKT